MMKILRYWERPTLKASFLLLSEAQLRVIQALMEFPAKVCSHFCCLANNYQDLSHSRLSPLPGATRNWTQWGNMWIRGIHRNCCVGGSAKGQSTKERGKRGSWEGTQEALGEGFTSKSSETFVWFSPQSSGEVGKRAKGCREGRQSMSWGRACGL